jgi:hypothetical protein
MVPHVHYPNEVGDETWKTVSHDGSGCSATPLITDKRDDSLYDLYRVLLQHLVGYGEQWDCPTAVEEIRTTC